LTFLHRHPKVKKFIQSIRAITECQKVDRATYVNDILECDGNLTNNQMLVISKNLSKGASCSTEVSLR
uniref:Cytochrome P450 n=1 Tax=Toxocara canis TaxID=6265 RepID=A0A183VAH0_TOXCA